ncbi:hypothetical protein [Streptomyces sp. ADI91-18]|uniref:hypothetical protein n=1 Tax=Streptomyces sp. ADI91-18 TaxID=1522755 RepID=UPI000F556218|nr:hypothetical protein [Streptomyces sp. ADI91-18]
MTFTWKTPPWQRHEDCTHMAVTLVRNGGGNIATSATSLRGDDATEALADFLMGDPGGRAAASMPGLVAVVVRRGIDVMWMAQPPIQVSSSDSGEWTLAVHGVDEADVTAFSSDQVQELLAQLQAQYGRA